MSPSDAFLPVHGGDWPAAQNRWGQPARGWLDLSTGLNPWPYPVQDIPVQAWTHLPTSHEQDLLRQAACHAYGVVNGDHVLAGPGTSALIQAIPRILSPRRVAILAPTYGEHARAWAAAHHDVRMIEQPEQAHDSAVLIVVNPNNPDGRRWPKEQILSLLDGAGGAKDLVLVDEAFADCHPEHSLSHHRHPRLLVLRSFGKFYGLAGIRLGFVLGEPHCLDPVARQLGPWPVSGPAIRIGIQALLDDAWASRTRRILADARQQLDEVLEQAGLTVLGGTDLFRLASHPQARTLYDHLGRRGILTRAFDFRPDILRFGLPGSAADRQRLQQALED